MYLSRNRRLLVLSLLFFALNVLEAATDKYRCMWREDPATSMVIGWNQISGQNALLYYDVIDHGNDVAAYAFQATVSRKQQARGMNNAFVRLRDLQPATIYYFIIQDSEGISRRLSFRTAPDNPYERLSIIAGGDSRNFRKARCKANQLVAKLRPHFVLFGGDMTGGDNARQWNQWMDDWQYTIAEDGRLTPIVVARGNHEYSNKTLIDLFDLAEPRAYYALSIGGNLLRIYTLNSLIASGGDQRTWLEKDLQNSEDYIWKMAQYHFAIRPHTARKTERNDQLRNWATLFDQYKVNLVVESDAHVVKWTYPVRPARGTGSDEGFIRDDENGTVYVGEGCWGAPLRRNNDDKKWTRNSGSFNQFKWIFVDMDQMEVRTVKTDAAEQVAAVDPNHIFVVPAGLDLWKPTNGSVITINRSMAQFANQALASKGERMKVINFAAQPTPEAVSISWNTEDESAAAISFEVQRSKDGKNYETISQLSGQGNGNHEYLFFDHGISTSAVKKLSYRLREITPSGIIRVYNPQSVSFRPDDWEAHEKLSPDTESGILQARYALRQDADISIRLVDTTDKVIAWADYKNRKAGTYLKSIDMRRVPAGHYLLTVSADKEVVEQFWVVK